MKEGVGSVSVELGLARIWLVAVWGERSGAERVKAEKRERWEERSSVGRQFFAANGVSMCCK